MTAPDSVPLRALAEENLASASPDLLRAMVKTFADALMSAEADVLCNAEYGQVNEERVNHRNGYRPREWDTRAGTVCGCLGGRADTILAALGFTAGRPRSDPGRQAPSRGTEPHVGERFGKLRRRTERRSRVVDFSLPCPRRFPCPRRPSCCVC